MSRSPRLAPWQLWWVDLGNAIGHEQGGLLPTLVVSSETHCRFPIDMTLIVPLTTRNRGLEHHVRIASPESGLNRPSWARTEDIRAVSTKRFTQPKPIGTASADEIAELREWLREMVAFF